ncbi:hypothetical protein [Clostridium sp. MD294]|uniref:hypothetical protein n=1 Tax=Clostridium sp. MD294 TaxID=97138 RepID=UPI0002C92C1D|nr:hypothetical protein [Clostridium sp. MD294]NDO46503.1 hypothetical protein [Clostridium sp. MD294]USF29067.1 hypothetical protein C820_000450 [Clostridium sp. MD294]
MRYAQINENDICIADSFLSGEVIAENMIPLTDEEPSPLTKKYVNGVWEEVKKEQQTQIQSDTEMIMQSIAELELQNYEAQSERHEITQKVTELELKILQGGK